ncbi:LOW QUALITY PROTEIN: hypothetical protein V2J09_018239 [Rumex salicifolius]
MQAFAIGQISVPVLQASPNSVEIGCAIPQPGLYFIRKPPKFQDVCLFRKTHIMLRPLHNGRTHFAPMAASSVSAGSPDYVEEPATKVKFLKSMNVPGSLTSLSLLGTGYREKVFAIIGVYAAGLYANPSIFKELSSWIGNSSAETQDNSPLFTSMYQSSLEKSLEIVLVRDVDGETFWNALSEALMPKLKKQTPVDESALSTFKGIFEGQPLKKGTRIHLTWLEPSKMLVSVSSEGTSAGLDGQITSLNVTKALFDVFFGDSTVSPTLKDSVLTTLRSDLQ